MAQVEAATSPRAALEALEAARRRRRLSHLDLFELAYRAWLIAAAAGVAVLELGGLGDEAKASPEARIRFDNWAPHVTGLLIAVGVALFLRSAARGGPLALEQARAYHVLQAPIPARVALGGPIRSFLRRCIAWGAAVGAAVGAVAFRILPGGPGRWIGVGSVLGACVGALWGGVGLVGAGMRISRRQASFLGGVVVCWALGDLVAKLNTSPFSALGQLAIWPLEFRAFGAVGMVVAIGLAAAGFWIGPGLSAEAALARAELVGALRFAATTRDLRAVVVLHRQLAGSGLRSKPWISLRPRPRRLGLGWTVVRRDMAPFARWKAGRLGRLVALGALAGLALRFAWRAEAASAIAAVCLWIAALDLSEGLAGEQDHPELLAMVPRSTGSVHLRHLIVPAVGMVALGAVGLGVAAGFGHGGLVVEIGGASLLPAALCATGGAAIAVLRAPGGLSGMPGLAPEVAGSALLLREAIPPAVAFVGIIPVLVARQASLTHAQPPFDAAVNAAFFSLVVPIGVFGWVHARSRPQVQVAPAPSTPSQLVSRGPEPEDPARRTRSRRSFRP